jgi:hypothetical protein
MPEAEQPSLYDRLGGVYSIATVVDDFINRIMIDPRLNSNPMVDAAHHRVPPAGVSVYLSVRFRRRNTPAEPIKPVPSSISVSGSGTGLSAVVIEPV